MLGGDRDRLPGERPRGCIEWPRKESTLDDEEQVTGGRIDGSAERVEQASLFRSAVEISHVDPAPFRVAAMEVEEMPPVRKESGREVGAWKGTGDKLGITPVLGGDLRYLLAPRGEKNHVPATPGALGGRRRVGQCSNRSAVDIDAFQPAARKEGDRLTLGRPEGQVSPFSALQLTGGVAVQPAQPQTRFAGDRGSVGDCLPIRGNRHGERCWCWRGREVEPAVPRTRACAARTTTIRSSRRPPLQQPSTRRAA